MSHGVLASGLVSSTLSYTLLAKDESSKEKGIKEVDFSITMSCRYTVRVD